MIEVTRLNGKKYWVNPHQIESMEQNPDVTLALLSGKKIVVKESFLIWKIKRRELVSSD